MAINRRPVQWKRLLVAIGLGLSATVLLTPLAEWALGAAPRKTGKLILQLTFLVTLVFYGRPERATLAEETGLKSGERCRLWWIGFLCGASSLGLFMAGLTLIGERYLDGFQGWGHLAQYAAKYVPLAFIIGILEDVTFFGVLYSVMGRRLTPPIAVFAITHFIHGDKTPFDGPLMLHGVEVLARMGTSLSNIVHQPTEAIGLALIGCVLLGIRVQTGSIWCSMGVHGGWYYARMLGRKFNKDHIGEYEWFYGTNRFCDGVLGWCVIIGAGVAIHYWWSRKHPYKNVTQVLSDS